MRSDFCRFPVLNNDNLITGLCKCKTVRYVNYCLLLYQPVKSPVDITLIHQPVYPDFLYIRHILCQTLIILFPADYRRHLVHLHLRAFLFVMGADKVIQYKQHEKAQRYPNPQSEQQYKHAA